MSDSQPHLIAFDPETGRRVAVFRMRGLARFAPAAFLALWLCGWLTGEVFAGTTLVYMILALVSPELAREIPGAPAVPAGVPLVAVMGFLLVWFSFWTLGGLLAARELLRLLWSEDRIAWDGGGITLDRRTGPFRSRRAIAATDVRDVRLLVRDESLAVVRAREVVRLTRLGTPGERREVRDTLRADLGLGVRARPRDGAELPAGWETTQDEHGVLLLARRRSGRPVQAGIVWTLAGGTGALLAYGLRATVAAQAADPGALVSLGLLTLGFLALATAALWLGHGGTAIALGVHWIEFRRHWARRRWVDRIEHPFLRVERSVDSDGDEHAHLLVIDGRRRLRVASAMNGHDEIVVLARWMAARTGARLEVAREFDEDAA